jgi:hypothetical protein
VVSTRPVQVKLERAEEIVKEIMQLCLEQCESPGKSNLERMGSLLGDLTNNLRAALNYAMRQFIETRLKPVLSRAEYQRTQMRCDFPWSDDRHSFDKKRVVKHTKDYCTDIYEFLEKTQPYHEGNEWLGHLMRISNQDKHVDIVETGNLESDTIFCMSPDGSQPHKPMFFGSGNDRLLAPTHPQPVVLLCPCYFPPYSAFALKGGKWTIFTIRTDRFMLGLVQFVEWVPQGVRILVEDFNALMQKSNETL